MVVTGRLLTTSERRKSDRGDSFVKQAEDCGGWPGTEGFPKRWVFGMLPECRAHDKRRVRVGGALRV